MDPGPRLNAPATPDPEAALRLRIAHLQSLVAELLQQNQELRHALAQAAAAPHAVSAVAPGNSAALSATTVVDRRL